MDEKACCAHLRIKYNPVEFKPGSFIDRWKCGECGTVFVPGPEPMPLVPFWECDKCGNVATIEREILCWKCGKGEMIYRQELATRK